LTKARKYLIGERNESITWHFFRNAQETPIHITASLVGTPKRREAEHVLDGRVVRSCHLRPAQSEPRLKRFQGQCQKTTVSDFSTADRSRVSISTSRSGLSNESVNHGRWTRDQQESRPAFEKLATSLFSCGFLVFLSRFVVHFLTPLQIVHSLFGSKTCLLPLRTRDSRVGPHKFWIQSQPYSNGHLPTVQRDEDPSSEHSASTPAW
jgi:hypothetical protein